jgi:hypothetical protein
MRLSEGVGEISLSLKSSGSRPAERFILELRLEGPIEFEEKKEKQDWRPPKFPRPPEIPNWTSEMLQVQGKFTQGETVSAFERIATRPLQRDPNEFYRDASEPTYRKITCEEFRHGEEVSFPIRFVPSGRNNEGQGKLTVLASARNLRKSESIELNVSWKAVHQDLFEFGKQTIQQS